MKFEKIIIPPGWQESFTKYPNGRTIFEALSHTITAVNEGIEEVNQKVNQGLLAIDQAEDIIRNEITDIFNTLKLLLEAEITDLSDDLIADFALLQSQVLTLIADKANAADVYTKQQVDAQLADKVQKNQELGSQNIVKTLPNGVKDEFSLNKSTGQWVYKKRINEKILQDLDIKGISALSNVDAIYLDLVDNSPFTQGSQTVSNKIALSTGYEEVAFANRDNIANIGRFFTVDTLPKRIYIIIAKGTTLNQAKIQYTGSIITYQLATMSETPLPENITANTSEIVRLSERVDKLHTAIIALGGTIV